MIKSENAGSAVISGGVIVAAGGPADTLASLPPGKQHVVRSGVTIPTGKAGTLYLKYGPGTVPHQVSVRITDLVNTWTRRVTLNITGPGDYRVGARVNRVVALETTVDPKGTLDVNLQWRAVLAKDGDLNLLGTIDLSHGDAKPGDVLYVRTDALGKVRTDTPVGYAYGARVVSAKDGTARPFQEGDEGDAIGTFHSLEGTETEAYAVVFVRPQRS